VEDNKFVELHKDKNDPSMDGEMIREVTDDDELIVVRTIFLTINANCSMNVISSVFSLLLTDHKIHIPFFLLEFCLEKLYFMAKESSTINQ
jgi:hypothetical protein